MKGTSPDCERGVHVEVVDLSEPSTLRPQHVPRQPYHCPISLLERFEVLRRRSDGRHGEAQLLRLDRIDPGRERQLMGALPAAFVTLRYRRCSGYLSGTNDLRSNRGDGNHSFELCHLLLRKMYGRVLLIIRPELPLRRSRKPTWLQGRD